MHFTGSSIRGLEEQVCDLFSTWRVGRGEGSLHNGCEWVVRVRVDTTRFREPRHPGYFVLRTTAVAGART
jgi:hypothetical protein